ncbi:MAG: hypothetical protein LOY04_15270, partial [Rhodococcus ruber]|nr:hypothetical protein [Rhodococcus ruber]
DSVAEEHVAFCTAYREAVEEYTAAASTGDSIETFQSLYEDVIAEAKEQYSGPVHAVSAGDVYRI